MDIHISLKALGDPVRAGILKALCCGRLSVGEIVERFHLSQPAISHHLRVLRQAGLVTAEKEGTTVYYTLNKGHLNSVCCCVRDEFEIEEEEKD
ncbi:MAG: winged helix-turn-helix transcriptional regulator [Candidatus Coatesbacteria bacterium]|nr:MAG: winged helix-turn-helix transcriptional regulator [Candidatus Coatesbacteria bacterium]